MYVERILGSAGAREVGIVLGFCLLTGLMTWPWILHLRDAVADKGDPYMIAWTLWWDFHQTFHNPLQSREFTQTVYLARTEGAPELHEVE